MNNKLMLTPNQSTLTIPNTQLGIGFTPPHDRDINNIVFKAGKNVYSENPEKLTNKGSIIFESADGENILKINDEGFFVNGVKCDDHYGLYYAMWRFIGECFGLK